MFSRKYLKVTSFVFVLFLFLGGILVLTQFTTPAQLLEAAQEAGPLTPLLFILFQVTESILPVFPGVVLTAAGGYLFGTFLGFLYGFIAYLIGSTIVFFTARKVPFGDIMSRKELDRYDIYFKKYGLAAVFVARMAIIFPNSIISFSAGISKMPFWKFTLISAAGLIPVQFVFAYFGSSLTGLNNLPIIPGMIISLVLIIIYYLERKR